MPFVLIQHAMNSMKKTQRYSSHRKRRQREVPRGEARRRETRPYYPLRRNGKEKRRETQKGKNSISKWRLMETIPERQCSESMYFGSVSEAMWWVGSGREWRADKGKNRRMRNTWKGDLRIFRRAMVESRTATINRIP